MVIPALSPAEFADKYLCYDDPVVTLDDLYEYMENHPDDDHWDYPVDEYDETFTDGVATDVVLVQDPVTREERWFEIDATGEEW